MWIDSHCHLNYDRLDELGEISEIVKRANDSGVSGILNVCCRIGDDFPNVLKTAEEFDNVWCSVGTHPHDAGNEREKTFSQKDIEYIANSNSKVIAIGETGLDYYYDNSPIEDQKINFRKHIDACIQTGLPLIVHSRDADEDMANILKQESDGGRLRGVMHCFSSGRELAMQALEIGFYISFSGIITFKKSQELRDIAKEIPLNRLLIETDAPFLTPEPFRKEINQPSKLVHTGKMLADIHGIEESEMAKITRDNFFALFRKASKGL